MIIRKKGHLMIIKKKRMNGYRFNSSYSGVVASRSGIVDPGSGYRVIAQKHATGGTNYGGCLTAAGMGHLPCGYTR